MNKDTVLQVHHLKKYYSSVPAVEDVSLEVWRGEIFGFLGPNGAGKSTTIRMLTGAIYPTSGSVTVLGQKVSPLDTRPLRHVGALIENPALTPYLSARENLKLLSPLYPNISASRIDEVLELVSLTDTGKKRVKHFSTGMKQRLGVAMALFNQPELLILDEPTNGLDPVGMHEFRTLLHRLKEQGMTIFLSSHLLHEIELICDRVAVIQRGRTVAQGTVSDLTRNTGEEMIRITLTLPEQAAQILRSLPAVKNIELGPQYIEVRGISSETAVTSLVQEGIVPKEVTLVRPDLESVFLEMTR